MNLKTRKKKPISSKILKTSIKYCEWMENNNKNDILEIEKIITPTKEMAIDLLIEILYGGIRE